MEFKKTIVAFAITASSAFALIGPMPAEYKNLCLNVYDNANGVQYAGRCDETRNNEYSKLEILENGCAEGQISLTAMKVQGSERFDIEINSCLPPHVVQL